METRQIDELWNKLKKEGVIGVSRILHSRKNAVRVSTIYRKPENYYGIAFSFGTNKTFDIKNLKQLEELQIELTEDTAYEDSKLLTIELVDSNNLIVFKSLCIDLIRQIEAIEDASEAFKNIVNQLHRWNSLFKKGRNKEGLNPNEQLGLYGELYFLKRLLTKTDLDFCKSVSIWVGPESAVRDFEYETAAVEIKSTIANLPLTTAINGERQLDESLLEYLYIFHLLIEKKQGQELTLPILVDSIREILSTDVSALNLFDLKLFEVGYYPEQSFLYKDTSYEIRKESYYKVEDNFPRIKESDLRAGVGSVKYLLDLSACVNYMVSESDVLKNLLSIWEN